MPMSFRTLLLPVLLALSLVGCAVHESTPAFRARDARFGYLGGSGAPLDRAAMCHGRGASLSQRDTHATHHYSYPETAPALSCFTPVRYTDRAIEFSAPPPGCAYGDASQRSKLRALADRLELPADARSARGGPLLACDMPDDARDATIRHNARVLRANAERLEHADAPAYPYAAVIVFGYGFPQQAASSMVDWRPGDACHRPTNADLHRLGAMVERSRRVADALRAGVAPIAIVSGGAEHSRMVEAFAMLFLLQCGLGVRADRVLLEPCADHTHTNVRNSGRWLVAMGARAGYIVTDDGTQATYLQEIRAFVASGSSIDQRSLREFDHGIGAWRQAAVGPNVGFWYTPYRFWAEPRNGLGSVTCLDV